MLINREIIENIGESGINFIKSLKFIAKGQINFDETAFQITKAGMGSVFIVSITAIFIGLAMSTQLAKELSEQFGAEHFVGGLISVATVRELAPVITAIVVIGRVGASISAEIGSMKITEQIDALKVLGINPIKFLLVPRLIAAAVITPLLTIISAFLAISSGMILTKYTVNLSPSIYLNSARQFLLVTDVYVMMLKAAIFGIIIAILATTTGLQAGNDAEAVGTATTKTVVWSIMTVFAFNYIITSIFFGV
jgi:phospholipid/cholesterol/gamma-HCH transport system permease protein